MILRMFMSRTNSLLNLCLKSSRKCTPRIRRTAMFSTSSHVFGDSKDPNNTSDEVIRNESNERSVTNDSGLPSKEEISKLSFKDLQKEAFSDATNGIDIEFPSDESDFEGLYNKQPKKYRFKQDPSKSSVILFPGQGSQFVGMGKQLLEYPNVPDMFNMASEILKYDLLNLCLNGPKNELDKTIYCQPAVLVCSLAAVEKLKHTNPKAVEDCVSTAGFSVGEYAAYTFAGSLTYEDAVSLINVRAKAMQKASEEIPSGMMAVFVKADSQVGKAMKAAELYMKERMCIEKPVIKIANYLYTGCKVLAGHSEGLYFIEKVYKEFGIKRIRHLPVSGAFHTELMYSARAPLDEALSCLTIQKPVISVVSNVTGKKMVDPRFIRRNLVRQVTNQVLWEQSIHNIYSRHQGQEFPNTYECGPGGQLSTMLKLTNGKAYAKARRVEV